MPDRTRLEQDEEVAKGTNNQGTIEEFLRRFSLELKALTVRFPIVEGCYAFCFKDGQSQLVLFAPTIATVKQAELLVKSLVRDVEISRVSNDIFHKDNPAECSEKGIIEFRNDKVKIAIHTSKLPEKEEEIYGF